MDFYGAYLTIMYTVLLHFNVVETGTLIFYNLVEVQIKAAISFIQGLVFISYPLIGLLADIKLTRYRMISLSCWVIFISHAGLSIGCIIGILSNSINYRPSDFSGYILIISIAIMLVLAVIGKGMFESTVIQFGTDQMIEASSAQLSTFIHWYYWSLYIGSVCINVIAFGMAQYFSQCKLHIQDLHENANIILYVLIPICSLQCILCCITFLLLYLKNFKNYLNIEPVGINPVKQIIDVLKYAYHHKYPVRRSALSYYRNTYPSRLDFGKVQYGGPFTNEEVEDTKTVLRLLVLLLSLFGFHLSSDEFSVNNHVLYKSCPSSLALLYFISNPSILTNIITLVGIPVFHVLVKSSFGKYVPNMIKRMWFGMLLLFLQELVSLIIANQISYINCEYYMGIFGPHYKLYRSPTRICYFSIIQYINNTEWNTTNCVSICPSSLYIVDSTLMWLLVPQIIHGFGYMLVFVSVLEFICAQAPFRLKGFMIGIWYAMFSLKYLLINMIDSAVIYYGLIERTWIIYESIKIGIIGLSLIIFGIICRWYRYRERDEVVNVQGMIEEIVERELLQQQNEEESTNGEDIVLISSQTNYHTFH